MVAWDSSQNLGTPPLVSPQNDVWRWLQKFHTGDVMCHYPDPDWSPVVSLSLLSGARGVMTPFSRRARYAKTSGDESDPDLSSASECNLPSAHDQSEALPRSGYWHLSMKFLQSFPSETSVGAVFSGYLTVECSHVGKHRPRCRLWKSKLKFFPHNLLLAAIFDFGEGYKSCLFSFKAKKWRFKHKN